MEAGAAGERVPLREAEDSTAAAAAGEEIQNSSVRARGVELQGFLTVDGPLGAQHEEALKLAQNFFYGGFCLLPWLWIANCFYFWPVLRHRQLDPPTRVYVLWSGIWCLAFSTMLLGWFLIFTIGGKRVFGASWEHLIVYDIADKYTTAWAWS